jgi:hypothetical protein
MDCLTLKHPAVQCCKGPANEMNTTDMEGQETGEGLRHDNSETSIQEGKLNLD